MKGHIGALALGGIAGAIGYRTAIRPWYRRWGATETEIARAMPLDERFPKPQVGFTMGISIDASPEQIWPWLAQIGDPPRAGYYSYTWIERLVGMKVTNAGRILPDQQELAIGQALDKTGTMLVQAFEPNEYLVLGPPETLDMVGCTWAFALYPEHAHRTRLVCRLRARFSWREMLRTTNPLMWPMWVVMEPGAFIMQRKMMLEIKRLAETHHTAPVPSRPTGQQGPVPDPPLVEPAAAPAG